MYERKDAELWLTIAKLDRLSKSASRNQRYTIFNNEIIEMYSSHSQSVTMGKKERRYMPEYKVSTDE
jgi:hypothetical protein